MKYLLSTMIFVAAATASSAKAGDIPDGPRGGELPQKGTNVTSVTFGENSKLMVLPSARTQIRTFYRDVLGCIVTKESDRADIFKIGTTFYLGFIYDDAAQSEKDRRGSIWLELRTAHPEELKQKILKFGIKEIEFFDKEHFYFQAPGGQVFRLVGATEDMSKWQR